MIIETDELTEARKLLYKYQILNKDENRYNHRSFLFQNLLVFDVANFFRKYPTKKEAE